MAVNVLKEQIHRTNQSLCCNYLASQYAASAEAE